MVALAAGGASNAQAQQPASATRSFSGPYVGASLATQNIFAGAFLGNRDVLAQDNAIVAEFSFGWRHEFSNRLVVGAEMQYGRFGGNLRHSEGPLQIDYDGSDQFGYGITFGRTFGVRRNSLLYAYAFETERDFDVTIRNEFGVFSQNDNQGMVRYGLGAEIVLHKGIHLRGNVGRVAVDFGDLVTNIDVEDKWDASIGLVYQF